VVVIQAQVDCIQTPQDVSCRNFVFPNSDVVVTNFCSGMNNMPGCTIYGTCKTASYNASTNGNGVCTFFSLAVDLCADMPGMELASCNNLTSMCHPTNGTSQVLQCQTPDLVSTLPTFMKTKTAITNLCTTSPPSQTLCNQCIGQNWMCDMLSTYTGLCAIAPGRSDCQMALTFCNSVSYTNWPVCSALLAAITPTSPSSSPFAAPSAPVGLDCPRQNTNPACVDYRIPNPQVVVNEMCEMMDNMPGCSVESRVCKDSKFASSPYCTSSSLMADVCTDMTMGVQGCVDYQAMCTASSVVKECTEPSLKTVLPTYAEAKKLVTDICTSMPMSDCTTCTTSCDYLSTYSNLCLAMPNMAQCGAWKTLCKSIPAWPYCSTAISGIPEMRMYFHSGIVDYVLFKGWVPRNGVQYAFTWIGIAVAGVLLEFVKYIRSRLEKRWCDNSERFMRLNGDEERPTTMPWSWKVDLPRSLLAALELGWGYCLMLVAMTFNVGLFFAVLFGCFVGTLIFGRFLVSLPKPKVSSCH